MADYVTKQSPVDTMPYLQYADAPNSPEGVEVCEVIITLGDSSYTSNLNKSEVYKAFSEGKLILAKGAGDGFAGEILKPATITSSNVIFESFEIGTNKLIYHKYALPAAITSACTHTTFECAKAS